MRARAATAGRVAFVLKGYPRLSETFIAQEIHGLERLGLDIEIVSLRHPTDGARHPIHDEIAAPVRYLPEYLRDEPGRVARAWRRTRRLPGYARARAAWLADLKRDRTPNRARRFGQALVLAEELDPRIGHIHAHFLHTPASVARYASLLRELPWTVSAHAKDIWTTPDWEKREKLESCRWAVTCTAANAAHLAALAPPERVALVYHGYDPARFPARPPPPAMRDGRDPEQPVRLLSVGRAVVKKGYDLLLAALAALPDGLHWRFAHVGGGPLAAALAGPRPRARARGAHRLVRPARSRPGAGALPRQRPVRPAQQDRRRRRPRRPAQRPDGSAIAVPGLRRDAAVGDSRADRGRGNGPPGAGRGQRRADAGAGRADDPAGAAAGAGRGGRGCACAAISTAPRASPRWPAGSALADRGPACGSPSTHRSSRPPTPSRPATGAWRACCCGHWRGPATRRSWRARSAATKAGATATARQRCTTGRRRSATASCWRMGAGEGTGRKPGSPTIPTTRRRTGWGRRSATRSTFPIWWPSPPSRPNGPTARGGAAMAPPPPPWPGPTSPCASPATTWNAWPRGCASPSGG